MKNILVVEDIEEFQLKIRKALACTEFSLKSARTISEAETLVVGQHYDLILLDLELPDKSGSEFLAYLQGNISTKEIPVIILTGKTDVECKVTAFALGADDYITKPFNGLELKARVEAKLKKSYSEKNGEVVLTRGVLVIHLSNQKVWINEGDQRHNVELTPREFQLLYHLAKKEEQVFSREQLLSMAWGANMNVTDRTVDTHVYSLRRKLGRCSQYIESVVGVGYRFSVPGKQSQVKSA